MEIAKKRLFYEFHFFEFHFSLLSVVTVTNASDSFSVVLLQWFKLLMNILQIGGVLYSGFWKPPCFHLGRRKLAGFPNANNWASFIIKVSIEIVIQALYLDSICVNLLCIRDGNDWKLIWLGTSIRGIQPWQNLAEVTLSKIKSCRNGWAKNIERKKRSKSSTVCGERDYA